MEPVVKHLGIVEYAPLWQAMQSFTAARVADTPDEIWVLQHPPVYTLGLAGRIEHILRSTTPIPIIRTDRGGQVTYHGPGQLVVYTLLNVKRLGLSVRALVRRLERAVIHTLAQHYAIDAYGDKSAPGVYVQGDKIAALGLRIRHGASYHGLALNVAMDLAPFSDINPCGYTGLKVTQLSALGITATVDEVADKLLPHLLEQLTLAAGKETE